MRETLNESEVEGLLDLPEGERAAALVRSGRCGTEAAKQLTSAIADAEMAGVMAAYAGESPCDARQRHWYRHPVLAAAFRAGFRQFSGGLHYACTCPYIRAATVVVILVALTWFTLHGR